MNFAYQIKVLLLILQMVNKIYIQGLNYRRSEYLLGLRHTSVIIVNPKEWVSLSVYFGNIFILVTE